jgi:hypothetical protein
MFLSLLSIFHMVGAVECHLTPSAQIHLYSNQPLTSAALLEDITVDKLFDCAKDLSEFAQISVEEYGHSPRVIGS